MFSPRCFAEFMDFSPTGGFSSTKRLLKSLATTFQLCLFHYLKSTFDFTQLSFSHIKIIWITQIFMLEENAKEKNSANYLSKNGRFFSFLHTCLILYR